MRKLLEKTPPISLDKQRMIDSILERRGERAKARLTMQMLYVQRFKIGLIEWKEHTL